MTRLALCGPSARRAGDLLGSTCGSTWPPARRSPCSGPTGPARRPCCGSWPACTPLDAGEVRLDDRTLEAPATGVRVPPRGRARSASCSRTSSCSATSTPLTTWPSACGPQAGRRPTPVARPGPGSTGSASPARRPPGPRRCRAARPSGWHWPGPSPPARPLCCSTSRSRRSMSEVRDDVRRQLRDHLRAHHRGPCIVVTHDPLDAAVLADRVVVLEAGRVTAEGTLADLVARPRTAWAAELAGTNLLRRHGQQSTGCASREAASSSWPAPAADGPVLVAIRPGRRRAAPHPPRGQPAQRLGGDGG